MQGFLYFDSLYQLYLKIINREVHYNDIYSTGENLIGLLERRLDAVVYRAKLSTTIFSARQLINHGHVKVNGKKRLL